MTRPKSPFEELVGHAGVLLGSVARTLGRRVADAADPDRALERSVNALVEIAAARYPLDPGASWQPGAPLRLLLAGRAGADDLGADLRLDEAARLLRHLLGDDLELTTLTLDPQRSRGQLRGVRQLALSGLAPRDLMAAVHGVHGVIACDDATAGSREALARAALTIGALGFADAEHKLAATLGTEFGHLPPTLGALLQRRGGRACLLVRDPASIDRLSPLELPAEPGTVTGWAFEPAADAVGRHLLREAGWDGDAPVVLVCPAAMARPAAPTDLVGAIERALLGDLGGRAPGVAADPPATAALALREATSLRATAEALERLALRRGVFVALVALTPADRAPCEAVAAHLARRPPVFASAELDLGAAVSLLRQASVLVAGREGALVATMPALVPSVGLVGEPRVRALMAERGQPELALEAGDPLLADHLHTTLERLLDDPAPTADAIADAVVAQLGLLGHMGQLLVEHVRARHPERPLRPELGLHGTPWDHLPPLSGAVMRLFEERIRA